MNRIVHFIWILAAILFARNQGKATVWPTNPAIAVGSIPFYADSSLFLQDFTFIKEGTLLNVLYKTPNESLDKDQNQQFKWLKVETPDGKTGWVFGDGVALFQNETTLPAILQKEQPKSGNFGQGFENARLWFGAIEGHDSKAYNYGFYGEYYVVLTNSIGNSIFFRYSGASAEGNTALETCSIQDITGDDRPEFIFETSVVEKGNSFATRKLEIYNVQNAAFRKIFTENMTLLAPDGLPAPSLFKCIDIEYQNIRIEYLDFIPCAQSTITGFDEYKNKTEDFCVDWVTLSYSWSNRSGKFELLYEPSHANPTVLARNFGVSLRTEPALSGVPTVAVTTDQERLVVLGYNEQYILENGVKKAVIFLYAKNQSGQTGYVAASKVVWQRIRQVDLLNSYCSEPPLLRSNWSYPFSFVKFY